MRRLAWIGCALAGMALLAPSAAWAQAPGSSSSHKHGWSLFRGKHLCAECQRQKMMAKNNVYIPPAPSGATMPVANNVPCASCGGQTAVASSRGGSTTSVGMIGAGQPHMAHGSMMSAESAPMMMAADAPGYAAVGSDPAAAGVYQAQMAGVPMPPGAPMAGPRDGAVMAVGMAPDTVPPPGANRPHVLGHLLGVSGIGRERREAWARRKEEAHASIPYGPQQSTVTDLPASVVHGRR